MAYFVLTRMIPVVLLLHLDDIHHHVQYREGVIKSR